MRCIACSTPGAGAGGRGGVVAKAWKVCSNVVRNEAASAGVRLGLMSNSAGGEEEAAAGAPVVAGGADVEARNTCGSRIELTGGSVGTSGAKVALVSRCRSELGVSPTAAALGTCRPPASQRRQAVLVAPEGAAAAAGAEEDDELTEAGAEDRTSGRAIPCSSPSRFTRYSPSGADLIASS